MQEKKSHIVNDILDRLKISESLKSDAELSRFLNVSRSTISNWRTRGTMDYSLLLDKGQHLNLNWLIFGEKSYKLPDEESAGLKTGTIADRKTAVESLKQHKDAIGQIRLIIDELEKNF